MTERDEKPETRTPAGRVWCMSVEEPIVSFAEFYWEHWPWRRLWSSYIVLPKPWPFVHEQKVEDKK